MEWMATEMKTVLMKKKTHVKMEHRWVCMYGLKLKFALRSLRSRRQSSTRTKAVLVYEMLGRQGKDL